MQEKEMLDELVVESREHLQAVEPDLLEMEQKGSAVSDELVNRVFRAVHSIKGGFSFFGIEKVVDLSHALENVMSKIRDHKLTVSGEVVDALLQGVDKLRVLLDDLGNVEQVTIADEIARFVPYLDPQVTAVVPTTEKKTTDGNDEINLIRVRHPEFGESQIMEAMKSGKGIYHFVIDKKNDVVGRGVTLAALLTEWEKFGDILMITPGKDALFKEKGDVQTTGEISLVFASVLEPDLIGDALEIPSDGILTFDMREYRNKLASPQHQQDSISGEPAVAIVKSSGSVNRIEDALRVKVGLLNNLMNLAGELVLARNQLTQFIGKKIADLPELESMFTAIHKSDGEMADGNESEDSEHHLSLKESNAGLSERMLREALGFRIADIQGLNGIIQNVDMVTTLLQEGIMQTRLQPLSVVFSKFPRVIRDLAKKMDKKISLVLVGQDVELDKSIVELLSDPLTHLIRNCADHGIELPSQRKAAQKSPEGSVVLKAYQGGGKVIIEITDDGAGINTDAVKKKALQVGLITPDGAEKMSIREIQMLIFAPGFSTAKTVSDVSGRGVGMDVVKTNIERLGGTLDVASELGLGTTVTLRLPLTLAIIPSLIVGAEGRRFALPQVALEEIVRIRAVDITQKIEKVNDSEVLRLRGKLLPLIRLAEVLGLTPTYIDPNDGLRKVDRRTRFSDRRGVPGSEQEKLLAAEVQNRRSGEGDRRKSLRNAVKVAVLLMEHNSYGLIIEEIEDNEEIVVKPLPEYFKGSQCYAGTTIMGDGKVAMILDPNGLALTAGLQFVQLEQAINEEKMRMEKEQQRVFENILLFSIGGSELLGVNLSSIARIEKHKKNEIESVGDKEFLKYADSTLRLFRLENFIPLQRGASESESLFVIVPKGATNQMGFISTKVEDAIETELKLEKHSIHGVGLRGSALIGKRMAVILDMLVLVDEASRQF